MAMRAPELTNTDGLVVTWCQPHGSRDMCGHRDISCLIHVVKVTPWYHLLHKITNNKPSLHINVVWSDERRNFSTFSEGRISFVVNYPPALAKSLCRDTEGSRIAKWKSTFVTFAMNRLLPPHFSSNIKLLNLIQIVIMSKSSVPRHVWIKLQPRSFRHYIIFGGKKSIFKQILHVTVYKVEQKVTNFTVNCYTW